jgi:hypothetical protein
MLSRYDLRDPNGKLHGVRYVTQVLAIDAAHQCADYAGGDWQVIETPAGATVPVVIYSTSGAELPVMH